MKQADNNKINSELGKKLSPILAEIEATMWEFDVENLDGKIGNPNYSGTAVRSATKIFFHVLIDKMYKVQIEKGLSLDKSCAMAEKAGYELRDFVKKYTGMDTTLFYDK